MRQWPRTERLSGGSSYLLAIGRCGLYRGLNRYVEYSRIVISPGEFAAIASKGSARAPLRAAYVYSHNEIAAGGDWGEREPVRIGEPNITVGEIVDVSAKFHPNLWTGLRGIVANQGVISLLSTLDGNIEITQSDAKDDLENFTVNR